MRAVPGAVTFCCKLLACAARIPSPSRVISYQVTLPPGRHKIVILDEADSMTTGAQQAMRRTMELYSSTTRFALACNNSSEIIEPIQSRCAILRFTKVSDAEILERLEDICKKEDVQYELGGLEAIIFTADGDMRSAVNALQVRMACGQASGSPCDCTRATRARQASAMIRARRVCAKARGMRPPCNLETAVQSTASGFDCVNQASVFKVCDQPHPKLVKEILSACLEGDIHDSHGKLEKLWAKGYSAGDIVQVSFIRFGCAIHARALYLAACLCLSLARARARALLIYLCLSASLSFSLPCHPPSPFLTAIPAPRPPHPSSTHSLWAYRRGACCTKTRSLT